jgi:hypothetical protein
VNGEPMQNGIEGETNFDDVTAPFTNRFIWDAEKNEWRFELTYVEDRRVHTFATKRMVRKMQNHP